MSEPTTGRPEAIYVCDVCGGAADYVDDEKSCNACAVQHPSMNIGFEEAWLDVLDTALTRLASDQGWGETRLRRAIDKWFAEGPMSLGVLAGKESPYCAELEGALERVRGIEFPSRPEEVKPAPRSPARRT